MFIGKFPPGVSVANKKLLLWIFLPGGSVACNLTLELLSQSQVVTGYFTSCDIV